jgi:hypothetical protein
MAGFFGGNSTKATSGINAALTRTQTDNNIADSVKQFYDDTLKSAREQARPDLIRVLTYQSASAVEWLQDIFGLDLTLVSRLGYVSLGHQFQLSLSSPVVAKNVSFIVAILNRGRIGATTPNSPGWLLPTR